MPITPLLLTACLLWAVSFIATKAALDSAPALVIVTLRLAIAALCFLPLLYRKRKTLLSGGWPRFGRLFLISLFGTGLHYGTQTVGIGYTTASNASLWSMTCPLSITVIAALFLGERVTAKKIVGILLALAGVLVVLGPDFLKGLDLRSHLLGDGLVFFSIFLWAVFTVLGKEMNRELGALEMAGSVTVIGALWMLPLGLWSLAAQGESLSRIPLAGWGAIVFLGAGCSFLATLLYFLAVERTESQKVAVFLYSIPPMTYAAAALLLGEQIGAGLIMGSLLVGAGVYLTERA